MSYDEQQIDPEILGDVNPSGLKPGDAVNGGLKIRGLPTGIRKINKKGLFLGAGVLSVAAMVAVGTFGGTTGAVGEAAKNSVSGSGEIKPVGNQSPWYDQAMQKFISDKAKADKEKLLAEQQGSASGPPQAGLKVPDLSAAAGNTVTTGAFPSTLTTEPAKANSTSKATPLAIQQPPVIQNPGVEQQKLAQAEQKRLQELDSAQKANLAAGGFNLGGNASPATGAGQTPPSFQQTSFLPNASQNNGNSQQRFDEDPNKQGRKESFLASQRNSADPDYSSSMKRAPRSPYELKAGAVIPAVLIGGINSDLPGQVIAQVKENVFDTKTGQHLLIPQGSRLVGLYDAQVAYGQQRVLLAWNRIIFPNGDSFNLKGMPGSDKGGYAGFADQVDNHYLRIFGSAILTSIISAGVQLSQPNPASTTTNSSQGPSVSQTVGAALGQQIGQTALTITQKNLNIQPTLKVRSGYEFNVMVTADMILPPSDEK
jgi:type IV secretory pathway VirB10-like protein